MANPKLNDVNWTSEIRRMANQSKINVRYTLHGQPKINDVNYYLRQDILYCYCQYIESRLLTCVWYFTCHQVAGLQDYATSPGCFNY